MLELSPSEVSTIVDALLYSSTDDVFAADLRREALEILRYQGSLPEEEE